MPTGRGLVIIAAAAFLVEAVPSVVAVAHSHGHDDCKGPDCSAGSQGAPSAPASAIDKQSQSYFRYPDHVGLAYAHILLSVLGWVFVLPIGVMLSVARSRFTLAFQFAFLLVNCLGLLTGIIYNRQTPDLYENNSHHKIGWAVTWIATAWVLMGLVDAYAGRAGRAGKSLQRSVLGPGQPLSVTALAETVRYQRLEVTSRAQEGRRWSDDSGQGTERNSASLFGHSRSGSVQSNENEGQLPSPPQPDPREDEDYFGEDAEKRGFLQNPPLDSRLSRTLRRFTSGPWVTALRLLYSTIDRFILILGFLAITTGGVVFGGVFRGNNVFSGLAHFIKGGIFFWYGLLTLGRWMGCFADFGWAWNLKPPRELVGTWKAAIPSAEFTESFVIFLYGASNVFLEHLAAWGGAWSAQDLEHVSITIMFFGGGLLGMLIEVHWVRDLLNTSILQSSEGRSVEGSTTPGQAPKSYSFPMNPMPGLVILLLGLMMGSHHQVSMTSTMIHKQWGTLLVGFALARAVTYLLLYISPPSSQQPARTPSELVASFCLVSGGLIFMASAKDLVAALEANDLDAMFVFTVMMGLTALIMAWETVLVAIKGWAVRRELSTRVDPDDSEFPA